MQRDTHKNLARRISTIVLLLLGASAVTLLLGLFRRQTPQATAPTGFEVSTYAEQPMLAHPVAMAFDSQNRLYVVETNSFELENLSGYREQLACRTVEDGMRFYSPRPDQSSERLHRLVDADGDGFAEQSTVFADNFDVSDGIASGVVAIRDDIYFGNAPNLWQLTDTNGDGTANEREVVHTGFGVRRKLLGHDLHGLIVGPDGKLYFSMGDRGLHIETDSGTISVPETGAVLRCDRDGSHLEVFATGLRNAQELAFDAFGNLWTCDNNANQGDKSRWVYVVEGGDSGWRAAFQTLDQLGPFTKEGICDPSASVPFRIPPVGYVSEGPAGVAFYPGTGLPASYRDSFLLCDYMGSVLSVRVAPHGAGFRLAHVSSFLEVNAPTDVAFGDDGAVYVADWVDTFKSEGQGRVLRIQNTEVARSPLVKETQRLLRRSMKSVDTSELVQLLSHPDQRVRQRSQFELESRTPVVVADLEPAFADAAPQMARIHAVRVLGALAGHRTQAADTIASMLADTDSEIRAQAAREIGERRIAASAEGLIGCLQDSSPRVRYFAAMSLGKLKARDAFKPLLTLARTNTNDPFLRHAIVMGLTGVADESQLRDSVHDPSAAARLASVLALRQLASPLVADFLRDPDPTVALAAARAIHDKPIESALPALADLIETTGLSEFVASRAINANFRLGRADAIAQFVARHSEPNELRIAGLNALAEWATETDYDRVTGQWRPIPQRDATAASMAVANVLPRLMSSPTQSIANAASDAAAKLNIVESPTELLRRVEGNRFPPKLRAQALLMFAKTSDSRVHQAIEFAESSPEPELRRAAVRCLERLKEPVPRLMRRVRADRSLLVQQTAIVELGKLKCAAADLAIVELLDDAVGGKLSASLHLELIHVAERRSSAQVQSRLSEFVVSSNATRQHLLHGGNAEAGANVFLTNTNGQCRRCHSLTELGGNAGPSLADVGSRLSRAELLSSIVSPNARIADGFARVALVLDDGKTVEGVVVSEDADGVTLQTATGVRTVLGSSIDDRSRPMSAMPQNFETALSQREIRDLIEFLSNQTNRPRVTQAQR